MFRKNKAPADAGAFYYGDWIRKPGVAICSCNDGLRPVIFKLEATDGLHPGALNLSAGLTLNKRPLLSRGGV